jgi:hypothetical protein
MELLRKWFVNRNMLLLGRTPRRRDVYCHNIGGAQEVIKDWIVTFNLEEFLGLVLSKSRDRHQRAAPEQVRQIFSPKPHYVDGFSCHTSLILHAGIYR